MVSTRFNLTIVGGFVIASLVTLLVVLAILAGRTGATDTYYTRFRNVTGLKYGSQVLYEGFPIGQVEKIEPVEEQGRMGFVVELSVQEDWKIPDDSIARSESAGLLAPQTVAITAGRSETTLAPGGTIRTGQVAGLQASISSLAGNVDEFTEEALIPLADNLNRQVTLFGSMLEKDVRPLLGNANRIMDDAAVRLPSILGRVDEAAGGIASVTRRLDMLLATEGVAGIDPMLQNARVASDSLRKLAVDLEKLMATAGPDVKVGVQEFRMTMEALSRHAEPFAQNLDVTSRNLQEFSRQLRQNPGLLLRDSERPDDPVPPYRGEP